MTLPKDITQIKEYIKNWQTIRKDSSELKKYLSISDSFSYINSYSSIENLHVYPGVCLKKKTLYMFLIDAEMDKKRQYDTIIISEVGVCLGMGTTPIPTELAMGRIDNWKGKRDAWIDKQVQTEEGIFEAFNVPASYMEKGVEYETFFSLKENPKTSSEFDADLITMRKNFYDVVRPVPPFGGKNPKVGFSLL